MVLFVEAPTFDLTIVSLKQKNTYILQRWSTQWDTFVDFNKDDDLKDGDKFGVSECKDQEVYMWYICIWALFPGIVTYDEKYFPIYGA